jgi:DNA-binding response OmpR family regulator
VHIDLVLLDVMMPEMDGYAVCERLKVNLGTKHIPVIFLTAKTKVEDIVQGFEVGGVDYVTKPFNKVELLARVKTHIELKTLRGIFHSYVFYINYFQKFYTIFIFCTR